MNELTLIQPKINQKQTFCVSLGYDSYEIKRTIKHKMVE